MDRKLIDYLPDFMREFKEIQAITESEQKIVDELDESIGIYIDNAFIASCNEDALLRYEAQFGITSTPEESIEERKYRLLALFAEQMPYTQGTLNDLLEQLCGEGNFTIEVRNNEYLIIIMIELESASKFEIVKELLQRVIPANLVINFMLRYNNWGMLKNMTWGQAKAYTWKMVKEDIDL